MTSLELIAGENPSEAPEEWRELIADTLERLDPSTEEWTNAGSALAMLLVDAVLSGDTSVPEAASDPLRDRVALLRGEERPVAEARGWLLSMLSTVRWALQRLPSQSEVAVSGDTQGRRFLDQLFTHGRRSSAQLREGIPTDHAQVSRVGKNLLASGLVLQRRAGREAIWELTPRGQQLMRHLHGQDDGPLQQTELSTPRTSTSRGRRAGRGSRAAGDGRSSGRASARATGRRSSAGARLLRTGADALTESGNTRYVVKGDRGWAIKTTPEGRTVETRRTRQEAVARAREIITNAGGGLVQPIDKNGEPADPIRVEARR